MFILNLKMTNKKNPRMKLNQIKKANMKFVKVAIIFLIKFILELNFNLNQKSLEKGKCLAQKDNLLGIKEF